MTAAVQRLAAKPPVRAPAALTELLTSSWHVSAQRLEIPVKYGINPGKDTANSWDVAVDEGAVSGIRDLVRLIAWGASSR
jgi:hypothetical protein